MIDKNTLWGTHIERGRVTHVWETPTGVPLYDVASIDRPGVDLKKITAICEACAEEDVVIFTAFDDGDGVVLARPKLDDSAWGSMHVMIDSNGHLIYEKSDDVLVDFELDDGHLIRSADADTDLIIRNGHLYLA